MYRLGRSRGLQGEAFLQLFQFRFLCLHFLLQGNLFLFDLFQENSYLAVQRSANDAANSAKVVYLYSAQPRDYLEFEVGLPDGSYTALHGGKTVRVENGRLRWDDIGADEAIVIQSQPPTDVGTARD